jgi:hypothetical protein
MRCSVGQIAPNVDVRADGGYIINWQRQGLPCHEVPVADWPDWLVGMAMRPRDGNHMDRPRKPPSMQGSSIQGLAQLDPLDYRAHDDWLRLMMSCHAAGIDREEFIEWSTSDPLYVGDAQDIGRRWDSLRADGGITARTLQVEIRLAQLNKGICPKHNIQHNGTGTGRGWSVHMEARHQWEVRRRIAALLHQVEQGREDLLFWVAAVFREEFIAKGFISPDIAVRLIEGNWHGDKTECRRTIAAAWLTVEDKLTE